MKCSKKNIKTFAIFFLLFVCDTLVMLTPITLYTFDVISVNFPFLFIGTNSVSFNKKMLEAATATIIMNSSSNSSLFFFFLIQHFLLFKEICRHLLECFVYFTVEIKWKKKSDPVLLALICTIFGFEYS